jgi:Fe-S-cluster-containing hydrogenase component 2
LLVCFLKGKIMKIIRNSNLCYACKTCQLACSFHHTKAFWPDQSSIAVSRNPQNGTIKWRIKSTCDKCIDKEEPLCVKYCIYGALQISNKNANEQEVKDND